MKYFFSSASQLTPILKKAGVENFLCSYVASPREYLHFLGTHKNIIIDSGAFSEWNSGKTVLSLNFNERPCDYIKLANKLKSERISPRELASCTNLSVEEWESLSKILDFNWNCFSNKQPNTPSLFGDDYVGN